MKSNIVIIVINSIITFGTIGFSIWSFIPNNSLFNNREINKEYPSIDDIINAFSKLSKEKTNQTTHIFIESSDNSTDGYYPTLPDLLMFNINPVNLIGIIVWLLIYGCELTWSLYATININKSDKNVCNMILILNILSNLLRVFIIYVYFNTWLIILLICVSCYTILKCIQLLLSYNNIEWLKYTNDKIFLRLFLQNSLGIAIITGIIELLFYGEIYATYYHNVELDNITKYSVISAIMYMFILFYYLIDVVYFKDFTKYTVSPYICIVLFYVYILLTSPVSKLNIFYLIICGITVLTSIKTIRKLVIILMPNKIKLQEKYIQQYIDSNNKKIKEKENKIIKKLKKLKQSKTVVQPETVKEEEVLEVSSL